MRLLRYGALFGSMVCVTLAGLNVTGAADSPPAAAPQSLSDKASYALGMSFASQFKSLPVDINLNTDMIVQGIRDTMAGRTPLLSEKDAQTTMTQFMEDVQNRMIEQAKVAAERAKKEGPAFLAANGKKPDVKTTASGLQYKVIKQGTGRKPTAEDSVLAHYRGTFLDGKEFDSSYSRGEPATFPLQGVIPGWTEALQLMPVGSKYQLFVPSHLAYGANGHPPVIPGNATLVFDVELLDVIAPGQEQVPTQPRVRIQK